MINEIQRQKTHESECIMVNRQGLERMHRLEEVYWVPTPNTNIGWERKILGLHIIFNSDLNQDFTVLPKTYEGKND